MMTTLKTAVIPVNEEVAKKMQWVAMPLTSLVEALNERIGGRTLRTDIRPAAAVSGVRVDTLFYEFTL
jgi:hypothetical protein